MVHEEILDVPAVSSSLAELVDVVRDELVDAWAAGARPTAVLLDERMRSLVADTKDRETGRGVELMLLGLPVLQVDWDRDLSELREG